MRSARQIARPPRRRYESPLRSSQREATRRAICEAAAALLRTKPEALTVAAVARQAGVSIPTVNRHFPTRQALLEGIVEHLDARAPARPSGALSAEELFGGGLERLVRDFFEHIVKLDVASTQTLQSAALWELRAKVTIPRRRRIIDETIAASLPSLGEPHRTWLSDLFVVLLSSTTAHAMRSYLGLGPRESADRVSWVLRTLLEACRGMKTRPDRTKTSAPRPTKKGPRR